MSQDIYNQHVQTQLSQGHSPEVVAKGLRTAFPQMTVAEAAETVHFLATKADSPEFDRRPQRKISSPDFAAQTAWSRVERAAREASLLRAVYPDLSPLDVMRAIEKKNPGLTMTESAQVLKHGPPFVVFPDMTCSQMAPTLAALYKDRTREQMHAALSAVGYAEADITAALDAIFPPAPQGLALALAGGKITATWNKLAAAQKYAVLVSDANGNALTPQPPVAYGDASAVIDGSKLPPATYRVQAQAITPGAAGPFCDPVSIVLPMPGAVLRHRWLFAEPSGNVASDSVGGVNGALSNAGREGGGPLGMQCVHITGSDQSLVNFTNAVGQFGTSDFSVALWFRTSETHAYFDIIGNRTASSGGNFFSLRMTGDHPTTPAGRLSAEFDDGQNYGALDSPRAGLHDGQWHHVAAVREASGIRLYVDGARLVSGATGGVTNIANGNEFKLGRSLVGIDWKFTPDARYADVRVYDGALKDDEVTRIVSPPAPTIAIVAGDGQQARRDKVMNGVPQAAFAPLSVVLKDGEGKPLAGQQVRWTSPSHPPAMAVQMEPAGSQSTVTTTDTNGVATLDHMLGSSVYAYYAVSPFTVAATCGSLTATFQLAVVG